MKAKGFKANNVAIFKAYVNIFCEYFMITFRFYYSLLFVAFFLFPTTSQAKVYDVMQIMDPKMHNICALTFDDGPHPHSNKILDVLAEENVKATFFVLGAQLSYLPSIAKRMHAEGHEVASHAYTHLSLAKLSDASVRKELKDTNALLAKYGIPAPRFLRPPLGEFNFRTVKIANEFDLDIILWSTDSNDWRGRVNYAHMPNMINEAMTSKTQRGIYLFHDTKLRTARNVRLIVQTLRQIGCQRFVTVSEYTEAQSSEAALTALRQEMQSNDILEEVARKELEAFQELERQAQAKQQPVSVVEVVETKEIHVQ